MKINANVRLHFLVNGKIVDIEVCGTLNSPSRPLKGDLVYWPYGDQSVGPESSQDCCLYVWASDFRTEGKGKLVPTIYLENRGDEQFHETGKTVKIETLAEWESTYDGILLLLDNPTVRWPDAVERKSWPASSHLIPPSIRGSLINDL